MSQENGNGTQTNGNGAKPPETKRKPQRSAIRIQRAAKAYVGNGGNATEAYKAAGYSPNGAGANAGRLTKDDRFQQAVRREMAKAAAVAGISTESVLGQLVRLCFYDPRDVCDKAGHFDFKKARRNNLTYLIEEIETTERHSRDGQSRKTTRYKLPRKQPALEALMRALGMEKEAAKNPIDAARQALEHLKREYPDLAPGRHEMIIAKTHGVTVRQLSAGADQADEP